ncbi:MAG: hypothetical protein IK990_06375 [Ruminiclostridium sp.]|nr:hypothetical protein [Ruminiclostridium sp.]
MKFLAGRDRHGGINRTAAVEREYPRICQNGGNAMTNYRLWKALDEIADQTNTDVSERMMKFAELLKQGYEEDLGVMTWSISADPQGSHAYHAYIDTEFGRVMMCYTSKAHAMKEWRRLPSSDHRAEGCLVIPLRDIINNMFNKQAIFGLVFNSDDYEKYVMVPKVMLEFLMPGSKPKPDNFKEPD